MVDASTCWFKLLVQVVWCRLISTGCYRLLVRVDSDRYTYNDNNKYNNFFFISISGSDRLSLHLYFRDEVWGKERGPYPSSGWSWRT